MRKHSHDIATEHVPPETAAMIERRIEGIVRHCCLYERNIIEALARSCYFQGLIDGCQVAQQRPEVAGLVWPPDAPRTPND